MQNDAAFPNDGCLQERETLFEVAFHGFPNNSQQFFLIEAHTTLLKLVL